MSGPAARATPMRVEAERRQWRVLYLLCAGWLMIVLDGTIVNVALPAIKSDLGFSPTSLAWVLNAYLVSFGGLLLLAGRLGDLLGHKRIFLGGLTLFTAASLLCGISNSQQLLVAARFAQGAGGALASSVVLAMIMTTLRRPQDQRRAMGIYGFVSSVGSSMGLVAGGILTAAFSWHWIFLVNLPLGLAVAGLGLRLLPADPPAEPSARPDVLGGLLTVATLMLTVYVIVDPAAHDGWLAGRTLLYVGLVALGLAALVIREGRAADPLIPARALRSRRLRMGNVIQAMLVASTFGTFYLGALYLKRSFGYGALQIGLAFLPMTVGMGVMSLRYGGRLAQRWGSRATVAAGTGAVAAGLLLFAQVPSHGHYLAHVFPGFALVGLGMGAAFPLLISFIMSDTTDADAGLASGLTNTTTQVAAALGLAVIASLSAGHTRGLLADGYSAADAQAAGYHLAFYLSASLALVAVSLVWWLFGAERAPGGISVDAEQAARETSQSLDRAAPGS